MHVEAWAGRGGSLSLPTSQAVEIIRGVRTQCLAFLLLSLLPCHLDQVKKLGIGKVGHHWRKPQGQGCGGSGVPLEERVYSLHSLQPESG